MAYNPSHGLTDRQPRVLAADDEPVSALFLKEVLKHHGFEMDHVMDGQEAVEMWETGAYDVILMDIRMPRLDGLGAAREIRAREESRGGRIPIVALTACSSKEEQQSIQAAGMDACLLKPVDLKRGIALLKDLLKLR